MEQLISPADRAIHDAARLRLRTGPSYEASNDEDIYLLHFAYVLIANAKLTYLHGCDAIASLMLLLPYHRPDSLIDDKLRKILDTKFSEPYTLNVWSGQGMTTVFLEVDTSNPEST